MGIYELTDKLSVIISRLFMKDKYFSKCADSKSVCEWLEAVHIELPAIASEGFYTASVQYDGKRSEAAFRIAQWKGPQYPTIIYHHGTAEMTYDFSFNRILGKHKKNVDANLIAIQALFNHSTKEFCKSIAFLSDYTLMLASSVLLIEKLIASLKTIGNGKIIVTGTSLGGFVSSMHNAYYNTADDYRPLLAGTRIAEVFLHSAYTKLVAPGTRLSSAKLYKALNIEGGSINAQLGKMHPLLARFDQIVVFGTHRTDFVPEQLTVIPYGHITGSAKFKLLRSHILKGF